MPQRMLIAEGIYLCCIFAPGETASVHPNAVVAQRVCRHRVVGVTLEALDAVLNAERVFAKHSRMASVFDTVVS